MANPEVTGRKVPARYLCQRYGVVDRTIDRWVEAGVLPQPIYINNRRYWDLQEVDERERERMANRARPDARRELTDSDWKPIGEAANAVAAKVRP
jgi:predicted DNA-binding transcriptional regulator AlpA